MRSCCVVSQSTSLSIYTWWMLVKDGQNRSPELATEARQKVTAKVLRMMDRRSVSLNSVVDHHVLADPVDRVAVVQLLAQSARNAGPREAVMEKLASIGVTQTGVKDVLDDVEEVKTQQKRKVAHTLYYARLC